MNTEAKKYNDKPEHKLITVTVDGKSFTVEKHKYLVSEFKQLVEVLPDYELDQVVDGVFTQLVDTAETHLKNGDIFVSHVRQGGSA